MAEQTGDSGSRTANAGRTVGWGFWLWWVLASTVGWLIGPNLGVTLSRLDVSAVPARMGAGPAFDESVYMVIMYAGMLNVALLGGAVLALLQWLMLRRQLKRAGWWVVATGGGWVIGGIIVGVPGSYLVFSGIDASLNATTALNLFVSLFLLLARFQVFHGAVLGVCQWLVVRGQVARAGWWVAGSTAAWAAGAAMPWIWVPNPIGLLNEVLGGIAYGAVSGIVLVWLLRRRADGGDGARTAET